MVQVSAYIPCYNNAATIAKAVASIRAQTVSIEEIIVIDDGSTDGSAAAAQKTGATVIKLEHNRGRGFVRALATREAKHELILCCDGNKVVCPNFVEASLTWLENEHYAGLRAHIVEEQKSTALHRWRARHMFREEVAFPTMENSPLFTSAAILRKSAIMAVGNYSEEMRHSEDRDLGERLHKAGYQIGFDPQLWVKFVGEESLLKVLDRYWRWSSGASTQMSFNEYMRCVGYTIRNMCSMDLKAGDFPAAAISFLVPHYQYMRTLKEQKTVKAAKN